MTVPVTTPRAARRRLIGLPLSGGRHATRAIALGVMAAAGASSAVGFALGQERARSTWGSSPGDWHAWHSFAVETHFAPVLAPLVVLAVALWARRGGFPRGLVAGLVALANNVALLACAINAHLFEETDGNAAMDLAVVGQLTLFALGLALLVIDPLVAVLERRQLEAQDPVFATARVVRR